MHSRTIVILLALLQSLSLTASFGAGPFAPAAGEEGSTAIAWDDPRIVGWADGVADFSPGPVDIRAPEGAKVSHGLPEWALGPAWQSRPGPTPDLDLAPQHNTVSLGDGGSITLRFSTPIRNGAGHDFVVFENGFLDDTFGSNLFFLELAFVEVSSNGIDFFRFDAVSLTPTDDQISNADLLDPTYIHNLAGKYIGGFGTPFDLDELVGISPNLDVNWITHVRIIDVVGSIDPTYASYDSEGNIINDPWPTNFATGGFDLDAIGALHQVPEPVTFTLLGGMIVLAVAVGKRYKSQKLR